MPTRIDDPLLLYERNDQTLAVTVTDEDTDQPVDISASTGRTLELIIKDHADDSDANGVTLSGSDVTITDGPNGKADVAISATVAQPAGKRFIRLDVLNSVGDRSTAWYKYEAEIVNL